MNELMRDTWNCESGGIDIVINIEKCQKCYWKTQEQQQLSFTN